MNKLDQASFEAWLATQPPKIRATARRFPLGTSFLVMGHVLYAAGYNPDGALRIGSINPLVDIDAANAEIKQRICPCCLDKLEVIELH